MKLNGSVGARQQGGPVQRAQYQGPTALVSEDSSAAALARAFGAVSEVGSDYLRKRLAEEQEAEDYRDLMKKNTFEGDWLRHAEAAKQNLPPDGRGYLPQLEKDWGERRKAYLDTISPRNRAKYEALAESTWQSTALAADGFTREAIKGDALRSLDVAAEEAKKQAYLHPDQQDSEARIKEMLDAAPGLTAAEREELQIKLQREIDGARVGGAIRDSRESAYAVPWSDYVSDKIMPALIQQESGGNAGAVSSAGAAGITQVMPGTARDIARALGDRNFPQGLSDAAVREYLKNPEVGLRYGTFYFNQMLQRYGGDVEAALIAYNGGPGRGDEFVASGRNYAVLPEETRNYAKAVMGRMGAITADDIFSNEFSLTYQQAISGEGAIEGVYAEAGARAKQALADLEANIRQAETDARQNVAEAQKQANAQRNATLQDMYRQTQFGTMNFPAEYRRAVEENRLPWDQEAYEKGTALYEKVNKEQLDTQEAVRSLTMGESLSPAQGDLLLPSRVTAAAEAGDQAAMATAVGTAQQINFVPPGMLDMLNRMLYSPDLRRVQYASSMIEALRDSAPNIVEALPDEIAVRSASFEALRAAGVPEDKISERMQATATAEGRRVLANARQGKEYQDAATLSGEETKKVFNGFLARHVPGVPEATMSMSAVETTKFQAGYRELYDMYFDATQDPSIAKEQAKAQMTKTWGVTNVGGRPVITHLPPEQALRNLRYDVNGDGQPEVLNLPPDFIRRQFDVEVNDLIGEGSYRVISTPETEQALQRGGVIPYSIIPTDEDGEPAWDFSNPGHVALFGNGGTFSFDYGKVADRMLRERASSIPPLLAREKELSDEIDRLQNAGKPAGPLQEELQSIVEERLRLEGRQ